MTVPSPATQIQAIVIGGSAGALEALGVILHALPAGFRVAVVIVLHVPPHRPSFLARVLANKTVLRVKEVDDKEPVTGGTVFVAPPNYHLLIERDRRFALSMDAPVNFSRPAIDVLFESAAETYGAALAGVVLSGANEDGARGLRRIKESGGLALVQSPESAQMPTMPLAAAPHAGSGHALPPAQLGSFLVALGAKRGADQESP